MVFLFAAAFIAAHTANAVLGYVITKDMALQVRPAAQPKAAKPQKTAKRDFDAVNDRNIFGAKREEIYRRAPCPLARHKKRKKSSRVIGAAPSPPSCDCDWWELPSLNFLPSSLASISESGKKSLARAYSINPCEEEPPTLILFDEDEEDEDKFNTTRMNPCNEIQEGVILHRIEEERIYFFNDNEKRWEYLDIYAEPKKGGPKRTAKKKGKKTKGATPELGKGIKKVGGNSYEVQQSEIDGALANLSKLATQARVVPAFEGGQSIGFKLFSIRPNSIVRKNRTEKR